MKHFLIIILCACISCSKTTEEGGNKSETLKSSYPTLLEKVLAAHGGLKNWNNYRTLKYELNTTLAGGHTETQTIDLLNRKVLIEADDYTLGMDGENVWVSPNLEAFGDTPPRFYHNLIFYFFAMPFVYADSGIQYEDLGEKQVENKLYRALKISYNSGIGDADKDVYIANFDPKTYQLELLLYTVTYFSGERHEDYNALKFPAWQQVEGLLLPSIIKGYQFNDGVIGQLRYQAEFSSIELRHEAEDQSIYTMPAEAEIDSLKENN